jgi:SAM-dependent methyltransferase
MWAFLNVAGARTLLADLQRQVGALHRVDQSLREIRADLAAELRVELGEARINFDTQLAEIKLQVNDVLDDTAPLFDRTNSLLKRSNQCNDGIEALRKEMENIDLKVSAVRREILFQQRRLTSMEGGDAPKSSGPVATASTGDRRLDSLYVALEDALRGGHDDIKQRLRPYLDYVMLAGAGGDANPILDIGCGRGEWLELLKDAHLSAYGIDVNSMMVERASSLGLDARHSDALGHLTNLPPRSLSAVTAFHVVEHLPFGVLVDFLDEALRVLAPGGILILETPNPETMRVGATTFYNDPTHRNPITPMLLQFLVQNRGFSEIEILRLHPFGDADKLQDQSRDSRHLNIVLFGSQDYAVIARRGSN